MLGKFILEEFIIYLSLSKFELLGLDYNIGNINYHPRLDTIYYFTPDIIEDIIILDWY